MRKIINNQEASAVPILLYAITIFGCGALYSLFFLEVAFPELSSYIPAGDAKVFIMMCMYALPLFIIVIGVICLIKAGLKREVVYR